MKDRVRLEDLREGDEIITDGGFTCMYSGRQRVQQDAEGNLYLYCESGRHMLDGQVDEDGWLVGVTRP